VQDQSFREAETALAAALATAAAEAAEQEERRAALLRRALGASFSAPINSLAASYTIRAQMRRDRAVARAARQDPSSLPEVQIYFQRGGGGAPHGVSASIPTDRQPAAPRLPQRRPARDPASSSAPRTGSVNCESAEAARGLAGVAGAGAVSAATDANDTVARRQTATPPRCVVAGGAAACAEWPPAGCPLSGGASQSAETALLDGLRDGFLRDLRFADTAAPSAVPQV